MVAARLFVANLPQDVEKNELSEIFKNYGTVENVELKAPKSNDDNDTAAKIIAFITIQTDDVDYCINELNYVKVRQNRIKVTLAKESFLDRLKREREEASSSKKTQKDDFERQAEDISLSTSVLSSKINTRKIFADTNELDDQDDGDDGLDVLINKKRAASSLKNGKIVIESYSDKPVHIIENKKQKLKNKNNEENLKDGDVKRKQSLKNAMQQHKLKMATVQQALSGVDTSKSNKIIFSDENEENRKTHEVNLFPDDDDDADGDRELLENLENVDYKKAKLFNLRNEQDEFDKRFQVDERFLENDENVKGKDEQGDNGEPNERDWQMGILEEVVGHKLTYRSNEGDAKGIPKKQMLRYDPSSQNQDKFLRNKDKLASGVDASDGLQEDYPKDKETASNEMFYVVSDTLAQSLKQPSDNASFSLLNMFGRDENKDREQRRGLLQEISTEKIMINNMDWNATNPFTYDSSDTDNEDQNTERPLKESKPTGKPSGEVKKDKSIFTEPFFFEHNDKRFQEGANFFIFKSDTTADYTTVRDNLNLLIKTQINKKLKSSGRQNRYNKKLKK